MLSFLKNNFQSLLVIALFLVIMFQRCGTTPPTNQKPIIITVVDTSWKHFVQPVINVQPTPTGHIPAPIVYVGKDSTIYVPSPVDSILRIQYKALRDSLLSQNIYKDQVLKFDSSSVTITDTVTQNRLAGRSYHFDLKYPVVTKTTTITNPYKPTRQLYVGGGIMGNPISIVSGATLGLMYKDRQDRVIQLNAIQPFSGPTSYEIQSFWKIKLHK